MIAPLLGTFESGTASTLVELHPPPDSEPEAIDEALDLKKYMHSVQSAPDLELSDIMLTPEDATHLRDEFTYEAINILGKYGGGYFQRFRSCSTLR